MDILTHAAREVSKLHDFDTELQTKLNWDVLSVVNTLNNSGYLNPERNLSGYIVNLLGRLLSFKPATELTGADEEWTILSEECTPEVLVMYNKRCPSVIKRIINNNAETAEVVDYDAVVISSDGGLTWWDKENCYALVQFPYLPSIAPSKLYVKQVGEGKFEVVSDETEIENMKKAAIQEREAKQHNEKSTSGPVMLEPAIVKGAFVLADNEIKDSVE